MNKGQSGLGYILTIFIGVIVVLALVSSLADPISQQGAIITKHNDTQTSSGTSFIVSTTPLITNGLAQSIVSYTNLNNGSNGSIGTNNWQGYSNGSVTLNSGMGDGVYNVTYQFYSSTYVGDGTSRTLIGFIVLFFILGIIAFVIYYLRKSNPDLFGKI